MRWNVFEIRSGIAGNEDRLHAFCEELELPRSVDWAFVPWFVENAWFFDLLKFEEYLMILIMVPIGLVAAFAIAIALMTSVLRKIREIGLLVAMGGARGFSWFHLLPAGIFDRVAWCCFRLWVGSAFHSFP